MTYPQPQDPWRGQQPIPIVPSQPAPESTSHPTARFAGPPTARFPQQAAAEFAAPAPPAKPPMSAGRSAGLALVIAALICCGVGGVATVLGLGDDPEGGAQAPATTPARTAGPTATSAAALAEPTAAQPSPSPSPSTRSPSPTASKRVYYANCDAVRAAGKAPLRKGQPGYRSALDRDGDGVACEPSAPSGDDSSDNDPPASGNDPRFSTCKDAKAAGYGPYVRGRDPEYAWYQDRDDDGKVCE